MRRLDVLLVIEDSVDDRVLYRRMLAQANIAFQEIHEVASAEEAIEFLKSRRPDCCLLDYQLPGMNGLELLQQVQQLFTEDPVPVIALTGQGDETLVASVMRAGAQDFLIKGSLSPHTLRRGIEHAMQACELQRELNRMAYYDSLTGLLSRAAFLERMQQAVARAQRAGQQCALFYLDLDHFKTINDTRGHDIGDELLKTVAERLRSQLRSSDMVGRLGGDEFVVLLENVDIPTSDTIADKIIRTLSQPAMLGDVLVPVSSSLGIAHFPETAMNWRELLKYADLALYEAKARGRSKHHHFSTEQKRAWLRKRALEAALPYALAQGEVESHYLPIYATETSQLVGFELLSRWRYLDTGDVRASELIEMIEGLRLMEALNASLIEHACKQLALWRDSGIDWVLSLNIAATKWQHDGLVEQVRLGVERHGIDPQKLELEINEALLMRYPEKSGQMLRALRQLGVRVALDNVGNGFISLRHLADLPLNTLKIDRNLWVDAGADPRNRKVIEATIALGRSLGLTITAQGVSGAPHWQLARELGCEMAQGFWLGPPSADWANAPKQVQIDSSCSG